MKLFVGMAVSLAKTAIRASGETVEEAGPVSQRLHRGLAELGLKRNAKYLKRPTLPEIEDFNALGDVISAAERCRSILERWP